MSGSARVALAHDWLTGMRGGEKVLEALCEIFPAADLFTLVHVPGSVSRTIEDRTVKTSFLQRLPWAGKRYRHYLPLMPLAAAGLDLSGYDLVISSSHCAAKGVRVPAGAAHLCYCHTPMRYVWDQYADYFGPGRASWPARLAMSLLRRPLQRWDAASSRGVRAFAANSHNVADRIRRFYSREAEVIHPPLDLKDFSLVGKDEGYYLVLSALVPYKRVDLAVEAFRRTGAPLRIVGSGPEERRLRSLAGANVEFLGWAPAAELARHYAGCRALIFPGEEDFGIVPLEAMACGKPVIAYGKGGALETVAPLDGPGDPTGLFFTDPTADSLAGAVARFEENRKRFDPRRIRAHVEPFDRPRFREKMKDFVRRNSGMPEEVL